MVVVRSFPQDKWDTAMDFLCAAKPWWERYARRFEVVPFRIDPSPGHKWGGFLFSTLDWKLYADEGFVVAAPVEWIAGLIERELQRAVRDVRGRLSYVDKEFYSRYGQIAAEMEICDVLRSEKVSLGEAFSRDSREALFPKERRQKWAIKDAPVVPAECEWLPKMIGMPSGMSLESYYQRFVELERARRDEMRAQEDSEATEGQDGGDDPLHDSDDQRGEADHPGEDGVDDTGDGLAGNDVDDHVGGEPSGDEGDVEDDVAGGADPGVEFDDGSDVEPLGDDSETGSGGKAFSTEGNNELNDRDVGSKSLDNGGLGDGLPDEEARQGCDGGTGGVSSPLQRCEGDEGENEGLGDQVGEGDDIAPDNGCEGDEGLDTSVLMDVEEASRDLGRNWYTRDYEPVDDAGNGANVVGDTVRDLDALQELAEDIRSYSVSTGMPGAMPGELSVQVAGDILANVKLNWQAILERIVASKIGDSKINGMQDVSYEVRNPHQPRTGVIMPGMYDSPVKLSLIIDVSGSMVSHLPVTLGAVDDVLRNATEGMEDGVSWVSVDVSPVRGGIAHRLDESIIEGSSLGFGGTNISDVLVDVCRGSFVFDGVHYNKPDVTIVITDCQWNFPEVDNPTFGLDAGVIVVSTVSWLKAWEYFSQPAWITEGINWVYAQ